MDALDQLMEGLEQVGRGIVRVLAAVALAEDVFGAVAGTAGSLGAIEVIKIIAGIGTPLAGRMLIGDLGTMAFRTVNLLRRPDCTVCGGSVDAQ